jgi:hypothetical protein
MAYSWLNFRVTENSEFARKWNGMLMEFQRGTLTVCSPLLLSEGISGGRSLSIMRSALGGAGGGSASSVIPFEIVQTTVAVNPTPADNKIRVRAGNIYWHSYTVIKDLGGADLGWATAEITVTSSIKVWATIVDPFATGSPTFTINTGAAVPTEPLPPSRKYWELGSVDFTAGTPPTIVITQKYSGGIPWPPVFGYWA